MSLFAIHGFLGLPQDWETILNQREIPIPSTWVDPYEYALPKEGFWEWAKRFNSRIDREEGEGKKILLGYSLGGRLAMHALLDNPNLWDAAVLISCHTGLETEQEKIEKLALDTKWASRFERDSWESLMHDWNAQTIFAKGTFAFERKEEHYMREILADTMRYWSPAKQENLVEPINKISIPILWIAGNEDQKYADLSKKVAFSHSKSIKWIVPDAGHRVPWEYTKAFQERLKEFITTI